VGITASQLTQLCRDSLSPLEIAPDCMNALLRYYTLPVRAAALLLRNTIRCAGLHPSLASTLARYDAKHKKQKSKAMQKAIRELYVKADIQISQDQEKRIDEYVTRATDGLES
jgi:hypothetical protein